MASSTDPFDTSFDRNEPGSSSTSPSRLPRILVENQPARPSIRAFRPGAMIVFIIVCPVLKSLPATGTPRRSEEHTSELQSQSNLVCRLLLEKITQISERKPPAFPAGQRTLP